MNKNFQKFNEKMTLNKIDPNKKQPVKFTFKVFIVIIFNKDQYQ
jgi:hypothetical protein